MDTKDFDNEEIRNKALKEFLKKPVNKEISNLLSKNEELTDEILRKGVDTSLFSLKSCLYALYIWKCLTWGKNLNNPSAYDSYTAFSIKVIKDADVNWDEYNEYISIHGATYTSKDILVASQCYLIDGFDKQAQDLIKAFYLLDYVFKYANQSFDTYTTSTIDNCFDFTDQKVIYNTFNHNVDMFYKYSETIWKAIVDKNAIAFTEMLDSPITFFRVWIDYEDIPTKYETIPAGLKLALHNAMSYEFRLKDLYESEYHSQIFDYESRIKSSFVENKFTKHLKHPENSPVDMLDVFDYYAKSFNAKTLNSDPEQMNALMNFDLNTLDISSYIPEKYKESYKVLIDLIADFAKNQKTKQVKSKKVKK